MVVFSAWIDALVVKVRVEGVVRNRGMRQVCVLCWDGLTAEQNLVDRGSEHERVWVVKPPTPVSSPWAESFTRAGCQDPLQLLLVESHGQSPDLPDNSMMSPCTTQLCLVESQTDRSDPSTK